MSSKKKLTIPKIKKKLSNFLTDESGKITKKDALGIGVSSAIFLGAGEASAHGNACGHANQGHANGYSRGTHLSGTRTAHINTAVNGHYSGTPSGGNFSGYSRGGYHNQGAVNLPTHCSSSHSSHGNHSNSSHSNY